MPNKQIVLMLKGLPASGKSTFAKKLVADNPEIWARVNADDIRQLPEFVDVPFSKAREKLVFKVEDKLILLALHDGKNVVVDDTNGHPKQAVRVQNVINEYNSITGFPVEMEWKVFDTSLAECIRRDKARENSVGEAVIRRMWNDFFRKDAPIVDPALPHAYIVDFDGTLCKFPGQSPYDRDFSLDIPFKPVTEMVRMIKAYGGDRINILVTSGRKSEFREVSEKWLFDYDIPFDALFMRADGDDRKDDIVKLELFDKNIKNKYNVLAVFDDRSRVVDMWRDIGLTVFQVDFGEF